MNKNSILLLVTVLFVLTNQLEAANTLCIEDIATSPKKEVKVNTGNRFYARCRLPQNFYAKSRIHFYGNGNDGIADYNVDFTLYKVKGYSHVSIFEAVYQTLFKGAPAPPYEYAADYQFKNSHWGIGARGLHYKYYINLSPTYKVKGYVNSTQYDGTYNFNFVQNIEHTDGLNLLCLGADYYWPIKKFSTPKRDLSFVMMLGASIAYPRTDATILFPTGKRVQHNNDYKLTGKGAYLEGQLKYVVYKFITAEVYAAWSGVYLKNNYTLVFADHHLYQDHFINSLTVGAGLGLVLPFNLFEKKQ